MLHRPQRLRAFLRYMKRPSKRFLPVAIVFAIVLLAGGVSFHRLYEQEPLTFARALYITYAMVFMEHLLPFPRHLLLQLFYVLLPPLGLVVILDGIMQYSTRILRLEKENPDWNRAMIESLSDHIILFGLGKAGLRTLQVLLDLGQQVCVLEKDPNCPHLAYAHARGVPVLVGTARQEGVLEQLNVAKAKSVILATDDDLANIELALDARKANPTIHLVARVFDQELAAKVRDSFGIQVALSTTALAAPLFAAASADPTILQAFELDDRLMVVSRITVKAGGQLVARRIGTLGQEFPLFVLDHRRDGQVNCRPAPGTALEVGDLLTLQAEAAVMRQVNGLNAG